MAIAKIACNDDKRPQFVIDQILKLSARVRWAI
jgi:hypothetical protein